MASSRAGRAATLVSTLFCDGTLTALSDEQLLERFVSQQEEAAQVAFEAIVDRHGPMVLSVCRGALRDQHDAEDAFQVTFLVLARKASSLTVPGRLGPWLHGVARRTARKVDERRLRFDRLVRRVGTSGRCAGAPEPVHDLDREQEAKVLHEEIERLPDRYRLPVVLCWLEGLTQQEAASRLGWPIGTVGVRLMRARESLRSRLTRRGLAPTMTTLLSVAPRHEALATSLATETARSACNFVAKRGACSFEITSRLGRMANDVIWHVAINKTAGVLGVIAVCGLLAAGMGLAFQPPDARPSLAAPALLKMVQEPQKARSIIANGGFEEGNTKNPTPDGWEKGARIPGVEYHWDHDIAHQGRASVHLRKTAQRFFPLRSGFRKWSELEPPRLKLTAFVKAQKTSKAILDVQFTGDDDANTHKWAAYIGAKKGGDPPVTHDWKRYQGIVEIPAGTRKITVAVQIYGPGDVWVDDVTADFTEEKATDPLCVQHAVGLAAPGHAS